MHCTIRIRVSSEFLGDRPSNGIMCFNRTEHDQEQWGIPPEEWQWLMNEAARALHLEDEISVDAIYPPSGIYLPKLHEFLRVRGKSRRWTSADAKPPARHEAIVPRTVLNFTFHVLSEHPPVMGGVLPEDSADGKKIPTLVELKKMFDYIGLNIGLSPWGRTHLKGRFTVDSLTDAIGG